MVARRYVDLGGFSGVHENPQTEYSVRGIGKGDRIQTFTVKCDPTAPFTGIVHIQGTVDEPLEGKVWAGRTGQIRPDGSGLIWVDLVELDIDNEGGTFFIQMEVELSQIRAVVKAGNYTGGSIRSIYTMI